MTDRRSIRLALKALYDAVLAEHVPQCIHDTLQHIPEKPDAAKRPG
jgi:hypothetical protein